MVLFGGGTFISGGILGVWFYEQFAFADEGVLFVSFAALWVASLVVMTRLCFITPIIYIGVFCLRGWYWAVSFFICVQVWSIFL